MTDPRRAVPGIGWMLLMSTWMISTVIPGSLFGWLGFLSIGIIGRMRRWVVVGVALGVAAIVATLPLWGQWQPMVAAIVYLGGMLLALAANPSWLRAMWTRSQVAVGAASVKAPVNAPPARTTGRSTDGRSRGGRRRNDTTASRDSGPTRAAVDTTVDSEAERLADRAGASTAAYFAAAETPAAGPVDVNAADAAALADLPGITRARARSLVKQRERQGGFVSLDAFATAAGLQPHELVRLRAAAVCSPPARGRRRFGRRVDY
ncbi:helix-hairpin-helix domain-containing protein [Microbacterium sp.]|uniref:helix-hairpin-helix domain-containing protein n=1 Tax=Microbacterium sp. TaxID=51671 RepID=UPI0028110B82|nr:helix-hairpin-helix domain-containing protein [Microbacterium sp.]